MITRTLPTKDELLIEMVDRARHITDEATLLQILGALSRRVKEDSGELARIFPWYGFARGLEARGVRQPWRSRVALRVMGKILRRYYSDRPGWNDAFMCAWFATGRQDYADEILRRCLDQTMPTPVFETARWMADSVRKRHPDFDAAMKKAESRPNFIRCVLGPATL